jgi:hypothetical protein
MIGLTKAFHLRVRRCYFFPSTKYRGPGRCLGYCFNTSIDGCDQKVGLSGVYSHFSQLVLSRKTCSEGHFVTPTAFLSQARSTKEVHRNAQ